ncbi:uncharacterized protein LOC144708311 [Wolffia australiana]
MGNNSSGMAKASSLAAGNGCQRLDEPPMPSRKLVVLMVPFHCPKCALKVRRKLYDMEGVETVDVDAENNRVTVTGSVDVASIVLEIYRKFRKRPQLLFEREERGMWRSRWERNWRNGEEGLLVREEDRRRNEDLAYNSYVGYRSGLYDDEFYARAPPCNYGLYGYGCQYDTHHHPISVPGQLVYYEDPRQNCSIM